MDGWMEREWENSVRNTEPVSMGQLFVIRRNTHKEKSSSLHHMYRESSIKTDILDTEHFNMHFVFTMHVIVLTTTVRFFLNQYFYSEIMHYF